jgi:hypothetical protein
MAEWIVVITPPSIPKASSRTLITGTTQLVEQDAAETIVSSPVKQVLIDTIDNGGVYS